MGLQYFLSFRTIRTKAGPVVVLTLMFYERFCGICITLADIWPKARNFSQLCRGAFLSFITCITSITNRTTRHDTTRRYLEVDLSADGCVVSLATACELF